MTSPLDPRPLSAAERDNLVRRVRSGIRRDQAPRWRPHGEALLLQARAAAVESAAAVARSGAAEPAREGSARCAARYAHFWGCSVEDAASEFGVGFGAVLQQWATLYPAEQPALHQRGDR